MLVLGHPPRKCRDLDVDLIEHLIERCVLFQAYIEATRKCSETRNKSAYKAHFIGLGLTGPPLDFEKTSKAFSMVLLDI